MVPASAMFYTFVFSPFLLLWMGRCRSVVLSSNYELLARIMEEPVVTDAICVLSAPHGGNVSGVLNFHQKDPELFVTITGDLAGLSPGLHGFHIHLRGDIAHGCANTGPHFDVGRGSWHGARLDVVRHVGDLGNVEADSRSEVFFTIKDRLISLNGPNSIVGRAAIATSSKPRKGRLSASRPNENGRGHTASEAGAPEEVANDTQVCVGISDDVRERRVPRRRRLNWCMIKCWRSALPTTINWRAGILFFVPSLCLPFCPYVSAEQLRLQERMRRRRCFADQELIQALAALAQQQQHQQGLPFLPPASITTTAPPGLHTAPTPPGHTPEEALLRHHFRLLSFARHPVAVPGTFRGGIATIEPMPIFGSSSSTTQHPPYPLLDCDESRFAASSSNSSTSPAAYLTVAGPTLNARRPEMSTTSAASSSSGALYAEVAVRSGVPLPLTASSPPALLRMSSSSPHSEATRFHHRPTEVPPSALSPLPVVTTPPEVSFSPSPPTTTSRDKKARLSFSVDAIMGIK